MMKEVTLDSTLAGTEPAAQPKDHATRFVEGVMKLDKGELAMLRRNVGNTLAEARGVAWIYRLIPDTVSSRDAEVYFLVATLIALSMSGSRAEKLDKNSNYTPRLQSGFGVSLRLLRSNANQEAIDRRFGILLDSTDFETLAFRLRQIVKLVLSKEVGVHWARLLQDLLRWNHPDKYVQKQWARDYYTVSQSSNQNTQTQEEEADHVN